LPGITWNPRLNRSFLLFNYCFLVSLPGVVGDGAGVGLVPPELPPDMPPEVLPPVELLPLAPAPAPARLSRKHLSRSAPVRLTHLAGTSVDAPVLAEPDVLPDAPAPTLEPDVPLAPVLPDGEPDDCANAAEDRARSAAAVAAVRVFSIIEKPPWGLMVGLRALCTQ
jgi:hypothetical protein